MKESDVNIAIKADAGELTKTMQSVSKQAETIAAKMADGAKKTSQLGGAIKGQLVGALSSAASGAGGLGKALSTAMTTGLGPIGLVTTAVTAIGGALKSAMDKSQAFGDFMTRIFAQVGAALSYILDTSNWGAGFADGLKQAIEVAGELADASDNAGTYTMEWAAKQSDLNAVLAESQAIMADGTAMAKERAAAVEAAKKAADDYAREAAKYTAARHAEIEATVKHKAGAWSRRRCSTGRSWM